MLLQQGNAIGSTAYGVRTFDHVKLILIINNYRNDTQSLSCWHLQ